MKIICWSCLKFLLLIVIIISALLAIYMHYKGLAFDPIREIKKLSSDNRRDDALDLVRFFRENQIANQDKFSKFEKDLEYTVAEKIKSFAWDGFIKGHVHDTYSGIGAISSDLCLYGDVRDLGIQGWKHLTKAEDYDGMVALLSFAGIGFSTTAFVNGSNALAKGTVKYLKNVPESVNIGLLSKFLSRKMSPTECEKIWRLLKKTNGPSPAQPLA